MKKISFLLLIIFVFVLSACNNDNMHNNDNDKNTDLENINYVLIDKTSDAYTIFTSIPIDILPEKLLEIELRAKNENMITIINWNDFLKNSEEYITNGIVNYEYYDQKTPNLIVEMLTISPGVPVGITWNGDLVITYNDYKIIEKNYQEFLKNNKD